MLPNDLGGHPGGYHRASSPPANVSVKVRVEESEGGSRFGVRESCYDYL